MKHFASLWALSVLITVVLAMPTALQQRDVVHLHAARGGLEQRQATAQAIELSLAVTTGNVAPIGQLATKVSGQVSLTWDGTALHDDPSFNGAITGVAYVLPAASGQAGAWDVRVNFEFVRVGTPDQGDILDSLDVLVTITPTSALPVVDATRAWTDYYGARYNLLVEVGTAVRPAT